MKLVVLSAVMAIALPAPAIAADWVLVTDSINDDKFYIDQQSIRTMSNGFKRAWEQNYFVKSDKYGNTSTKIYYEYDCIEKRKRLLSFIIFKDEQVNNNVNIVGDWAYVSPDSVAESLLQFVCRR